MKIIVLIVILMALVGCKPDTGTAVVCHELNCGHNNGITATFQR